VHGFEMLRARLERRQRLLNGLTAASWALLISVGIAIVALGGSALGLWGAVPLLPWVIAHALLGIVGFGIGWICPINSRELLFRADRHLQSHELLVTLYELSQGYGPAEFFPLLERRLAALSVTPARALPMGSGDRGRWAAVAILSFFCVSVASLVQPGWLPTESHLSATAPASHESSRASPLLDEWLQTPPPDLAQKLADMRERFERARRELALNPNDPRARAALQQLHAELLTEQERLAPPSPPTDAESSKKSSSDASVTEGSSSDLRPPQQSSSGAAKLDHIVQGLRSILEQAQGLSHEELKKLLEQLRDAPPEVAALPSKRGKRPKSRKSSGNVSRSCCGSLRRVKPSTSSSSICNKRSSLPSRPLSLRPRTGKGSLKAPLTPRLRLKRALSKLRANRAQPPRRPHDLKSARKSLSPQLELGAAQPRSILKLPKTCPISPSCASAHGLSPCPQALTTKILIFSSRS
jgi:hypothetical protein